MNFFATRLKNRCVANDKENIFYHDDDHLSLKGSEYVVDEIINKIKLLNLDKFNIFELIKSIQFYRLEF